MMENKVKTILEKALQRKAEKKKTNPVQVFDGQKVELSNDDSLAEAKASEKHAVFTFGRMNPPTIGHQLLVDKVKEHAAKVGGEPHVYLSHSQDSKKNPLHYEHKHALAKKAFGDVVKKSPHKTIPHILDHLAKTHSHVTMVVGSDRVDGMKQLADSYQKTAKKPFKKFHVVSAAHRDPDGDDDVAAISASKMRDHAKKGNLAKFKSGLPEKIHAHAEDTMRKIQSSLSEETVTEARNLTVAQRIKAAVNLRRNKARVRAGYKRALNRHAASPQLNKRARRLALNFMRRRVLRGQDYHALPYASRVAVDKRIATSAKTVERLAKRLLPRVQKAEMSRHIGGKFVSPSASGMGLPTPKHESVFEAVHKAFSQVEMPLGEQTVASLANKAVEHNTNLDTLVEVYKRGALSYRASPSEKLTEEQFAFNRVNSFLEGGLAAKLDADLTEAAMRSTEPHIQKIHKKLTKQGYSYQGKETEQGISQHKWEKKTGNHGHVGYMCSGKQEHGVVYWGHYEKSVKGKKSYWSSGCDDHSDAHRSVSESLEEAIKDFDDHPNFIHPRVAKKHPGLTPEIDHKGECCDEYGNELETHSESTAQGQTEKMNKRGSGEHKWHYYKCPHYNHYHMIGLNKDHRKKMGLKEETLDEAGFEKKLGFKIRRPDTPLPPPKEPHKSTVKGMKRVKGEDGFWKLVPESASLDESVKKHLETMGFKRSESEKTPNFQKHWMDHTAERDMDKVHAHMKKLDPGAKKDRDIVYGTHKGRAYEIHPHGFKDIFVRHATTKTGSQKSGMGLDEETELAEMRQIPDHIKELIARAGDGGEQLRKTIASDPKLKAAAYASKTIHDFVPAVQEWDARRRAKIRDFNDFVDDLYAVHNSISGKGPLIRPSDLKILKRK